MQFYAIAGEEILDYVGDGSVVPSNMNENLIKMFKMIPYVKIIIYVLIILLMFYTIMRLFNVKSPFKGKGIKTEVERMEDIKRRDNKIIRANKFMRLSTNIIEKTPLALNKANEDYWEYNIKRAGIKIPGGSRYMRATEFHSLSVVATLIFTVISLSLMVFSSTLLGVSSLIMAIVLGNTCPLMYLRQRVKERDLEVKEHFVDMYLMLHYVLIAGAKAPLSGIMKSYSRTTSSSEMIGFVDTATYYMDTYGEYESTSYITRDYREIAEVGKLMRLIRQANEGGEVEAELLGFREELIDAKRFAMTKRMDKLVAKANASFNILMPILVQAVISAMSIYMSDLGLAKGLLG